MKKLLIAAAAVLAVSAVTAQLNEAQAAPAKNPYCSMSQAGNQSWAEYYGCWGAAARGRNMGMAQPAMAAPAHPMADHMAGDHTDYCKLSAAGNASWAEHYGCWRAHR